MPGTITIATLKGFLAAFNAHDLDTIMEFFSDDCELFMPRGKEPWGTRDVASRQCERALPLGLRASRMSTMVTIATGWRAIRAFHLAAHRHY